ncbi:MAG: RNA-binding cell elongation regulator Jag/EloR [Anaerolineaceae bacterium]
MKEEHTTLEIIAPTVEEAVSKGLADLGLPEDAVTVDVLDTGSKGLFGLGSRQARVRLTVAAPAARAVKAAAPAAPAVEATVPAAEVLPAEEMEEEMEEETEEEAVEEDRTLRVARETVSELLDKMKVKATVVAHYGEPTEEGSQAPVMVDIKGGDLSILIGRRSETLNALQYIASLIIGKELETWVPLCIDVEGYRARRERQLRQIARRMAEQAIVTGKRQVLEPMPANERRLIHLELRDHPKVYSESIGEEPNRKVTIAPKK